MFSRKKGASQRLENCQSVELIIGAPTVPHRIIRTVGTVPNQQSPKIPIRRPRALLGGAFWCTMEDPRPRIVLVVLGIGSAEELRPWITLARSLLYLRVGGAHCSIITHEP